MTSNGGAGRGVVLTERKGAVLLLTLNRPERLNAWTTELGGRYVDELGSAAGDSAVRAVVVTGAGRGYCPGYDMEELRTVGEGPTPTAADGCDPVLATYMFPKPIIAAVNGACAGYGFAQALACDMRFAASTAKLTTAYTRLGLAAEDGTSWLLPRIIGRGRALDLLVSGRVVLGDEAGTMGLVDRVCAPALVVDEALAYATELAAHCAPAAIASLKRQLDLDTGRPFEAAVRDARRVADQAVARYDFREGVASFTERRAPNFESLAMPEWLASVAAHELP